MQHSFEKHLHEQYAINNNSNLSTVVSILVAMIAVFYGYGYVFLNTTNKFSVGMSEIYNSCTKTYALDALMFATIAVLVVTGVLRHVCLVLGYGQRFEQFITFALRCKYYQESISQISPKIFPKNYHPFKIKPCKVDTFMACLDSPCMKKHCLQPYIEENVAQGLYGEFIKILWWIDVLVLFGLSMRLFTNIAEPTNHDLSGTGWFEFWLLLIIFIFSWSENSCLRSRLREKYLDLIVEYKKYYKYCV